MFRIVVALTNIVLLSSPSLSQDRQGADVASGQLAFNNACRTCHSVKEGDNRLGPNLHKIVGRKAGSLANYGYSAAMKNADFVWDKGNPADLRPGSPRNRHTRALGRRDRARRSTLLVLRLTRAAGSGRRNPLTPNERLYSCYVMRWRPEAGCRL